MDPRSWQRKNRTGLNGRCGFCCEFRLCQGIRCRPVDRRQLCETIFGQLTLRGHMQFFRITCCFSLVRVLLLLALCETRMAMPASAQEPSPEKSHAPVQLGGMSTGPAQAPVKDAQSRPITAG